MRSTNAKVMSMPAMKWIIRTVPNQVCDEASPLDMSASGAPISRPVPTSVTMPTNVTQ